MVYVREGELKQQSPGYRQGFASSYFDGAFNSTGTIET